MIYMKLEFLSEYKWGLLHGDPDIYPNTMCLANPIPATETPPSSLDSKRSSIVVSRS